MNTRLFIVTRYAFVNIPVQAEEILRTDQLTKEEICEITVARS